MIRSPLRWGRAFGAFALALLLAVGGSRAAAQSVEDPIALSFLDLPTAPSLSALGGAGVAEALGDPHGFLYNPAHLGTFEGGVALALYPGAVDWLGLDLDARSTAGVGSLPLGRLGLPATLGVGVAHTTLDFGPVPVTPTASYAPRDRYTAFGLGLGLALPVRVQAGATLRLVTSTEVVGLTGGGEPVTDDLRGATLDVGVRAEAPVLRLLGVDQASTFRPTLRLAAGYAQAHIGGEVVLGDAVQPLPRLARLGYAATLGLDWRARPDARLRLAEVMVAVQAEHQLARVDAAGAIAYASFLGDLDVVENVLLAQGSAATTARRGVRVGLFETFALHLGAFDGFGYDDRRTSGFEVRLGGALRVYALSTDNEALAALAERFDLRLAAATYFLDSRAESAFLGLTFQARLP